MCCRTSSPSRSTSNPSTLACPSVGARRPHKIRMSVDLPEPLGPRRPKISPRGTCSVTASSARKLPKSFETPWTSIPISLLTSGPPLHAEVDIGRHPRFESRVGVDEHLHAEDLLGPLRARLHVAGRVLALAADTGNVAGECDVGKSIDMDFHGWSTRIRP